MSNLPIEQRRRHYQRFGTYAITAVVENRRPLFKNPDYCEALVSQIIFAKNIYQFKLVAFCILYDHFHFIIHPTSNVLNEISKISFSIKKNFSHNINKEFQIGFKWKKLPYIHLIRSRREFKAQVHYVAYNYLKHKLPDDWKYTSLNYPELCDSLD
jgi:REP element-mobilizing transposase RayT